MTSNTFIIKNSTFVIGLHINSKHVYITNTVCYDVTTHNPAGYTVIHRNDNMILQPHNTLATLAYFYSEMDIMT